MHGDIKPDNVLVYEQDGGGLCAKVIDFGYSCFGCAETDLVKLAHTPLWQAPEWRQGPFTIKEAKLTDVYSYGKLCAWVLFGHTEPPETFAARPQFDSDDELRALQSSWINTLIDTLPIRNVHNEISVMLRESLQGFLTLSLADRSFRTPNISYLVDYLQNGLRHLEVLSVDIKLQFDANDALTPFSVFQPHIILGLLEPEYRRNEYVSRLQW